MKVKATCMHCGRELLLSQLLEGPDMAGTCPSCGVILARDYVGHLLESVRRLEAAGTHLEGALGRMRGGWARIRIDRASILGRLEELLDEHDRDLAEPWRSSYRLAQLQRRTNDHRAVRDDDDNAGPSTLQGSDEAAARDGRTERPKRRTTRRDGAPSPDATPRERLLRGRHFRRRVALTD
jgi:hypothetical protein